MTIFDGKIIFDADLNENNFVLLMAA